MYKVSLHKKAVKYYNSLDDKTTRRINNAIEEIEKNPVEGLHIKRLRGKYYGKYRYAVGDLRIVYLVGADKKTVLVKAIGPRGDVYK